MKLSLIFLSCCLALWSGPIYFPGTHLFFFLPFLVTLLYRGNLAHCLSAAIGCGLMMDLLSSYQRLGVHVAAYAASITVLWWICRLFFFESARAAPLLAMLFSSLSTLCLIAIGWCMGEMWDPGRTWWLKDVIFASGLDGIYVAIILFAFGHRPSASLQHASPLQW